MGWLYSHYDRKSLIAELTHTVDNDKCTFETLRSCGRGSILWAKHRHVDKATGKEQSIVIKASSGLSDEEIEAMVQDAEANVEEDRKFEEMVTARNQADGLIHATRKTLAEVGDKAEPAEREQIESAITALEEALKGDDTGIINQARDELMQAFSAAGQEMYQAQAAEAGAPEGDMPDMESEGASEEAADDEVEEGDEEVVEADYEIVDEENLSIEDLDESLHILFSEGFINNKEI